MSNPASYTVGWICTILPEYVAAQMFLDEEHIGPKSVSPNDTNDYALGRIGEHNVVIAVLPVAEYGTSSAANVATNMLNSFPNVRIGLMVGIGGGVPSDKHDIRLGDVVVSVPRDGDGGVFQYDFGKSIQGQGFQHTKFLNQPPIALRTAIMGIQAQYEAKGHRLQENINSIFDKNPRLREKYKQPKPSTDRLFKPEVIHDPRGCAEFCAVNSLNMIPRRERSETDDNPAIHYGLIASANHLMKDALIRDRLAKEKDVLCFEMEAAGLMNQFPCLVIRGICDYSDSHKNKEWQGYASMVAAAFAKDLLRRIPPGRVETEKRIGDLSDLINVADKHQVTAQRQLEIQRDEAQRKLMEEKEKCLRLFRLTTGTNGATYEWYKHSAGSRVEGTCEWFLNHENFRKWSEQDSGPLLVSADPGCGKTVLAKYLIDEKLPRSATICYFFFKDQDQNTVGQALCALLHQLFSQKPALIDHAMEDFRRDGKALSKSTISMWKVFNKATQDPRAGRVTIVLDALDECAPSELEHLMHNLETQLRRGESLRSKLKFLLTSRPYEQIMDNFRGLLDAFPSIRIPGEQESESISREVNLVIQYRVQQLAKEKGLTELVKNHIMERLLEVHHRTYLWVYLVFDYLKTEYFKKTPKGFDSTIATLPTSVYEAYERILGRSKGPMVLKALSIILAATRPLTVSEMNVALNIHHTSKSLCDLDLEEKDEFVASLRTWCGLFISVHHGKIYFLHQTAREFLLADAASPKPLPSDSTWQHSIPSQSAHNVLAHVCVIYLDFLNDKSVRWEIREKKNWDSFDEYPFLNYSATNWTTHYRKACLGADADILPHALNICDPSSKSCSAWLKIYRMFQNSLAPKEDFQSTSLIITSSLGLDSVVKVLLERAADLESINELDGLRERTALSWAVVNGHETIVRLLLENGADLESTGSSKRTALFWAVADGNETIVRLLLDRGANIETTNISGRTPLSIAADCGHESLVLLLLERGANVESKDESKWAPLWWGVERGHTAIVKLLLDKGANWRDMDNLGHTLLWKAMMRGHESMVLLLLQRGALFDPKYCPGQTLLLRAIQEGWETIVQLLLERGADVKAGDKTWTPLVHAAFQGSANIVRWLLERGADPESTDRKGGSTPLSHAVGNGREAAVELLLRNGAEVDPKDWGGLTPLHFAASNGHKAIVALLLKSGADIESKDEMDHQTPLFPAVTHGHKAIVKILLEQYADFKARDKWGQTPLSIAVEKGHQAVIELLLKKGAIFDLNDAMLFAAVVRNGSRTIDKLLLQSGVVFDPKDPMPLCCAAHYGHTATVKLLLDKGANSNFQDTENGWTPLFWALRNNRQNVVKLLLEKGANFGPRDHESGRTPLSWAAMYGQEGVVKMLLDSGADMVSKDDEWGRTPLSWAAQNSHKTIVQLLLERGAHCESSDRPCESSHRPTPGHTGQRANYSHFSYIGEPSID